MNNKIKFLAEKAGFWTTDKFCEGETAKYLEKFTELVVLECASLAKAAQDFYDEHNDGVCITDISGLLKYNFGVKE